MREEAEHDEAIVDETRTTPRSAKNCPGYHRNSVVSGTLSAADPVVKPPPWIQTITGALVVATLGRHTLRYKQSSSALAGDCCEGGWGHGLANPCSWRTPVQGSFF